MVLERREFQQLGIYIIIFSMLLKIFHNSIRSNLEYVPNSGIILCFFVRDIHTMVYFCVVGSSY